VTVLYFKFLFFTVCVNRCLLDDDWCRQPKRVALLNKNTNILDLHVCRLI